jgi:Homeodomain-like domain/NUMOD3 motif
MTLSSEERERLAPLLEYNAYLDEGNGCWLAKKNKLRGYGRFKFRGHRIRIHRLSFAVFNKDFDDTLLVLHRCDVKHCYNPEHLFLGTNDDNMADMVTKGRQAKGERHYMFGKPGPMLGRTGDKHPTFGKKVAGERHPMFGKHHSAGEKNGMVKLREQQIFEILVRHQEGLSYHEIAKDYGVNHKTIYKIVSGKRWKHLQRL